MKIVFKTDLVIARIEAIPHRDLSGRERQIVLDSVASYGNREPSIEIEWGPDASIDALRGNPLFYEWMRRTNSLPPLDLRDADLRDDLRGINDTSAYKGPHGEKMAFSDANFSGANLSGVELCYYERVIARSAFASAKIMKANLGGARFEHCSFQGAVFTGTDFKRAKFYGCDFDNIIANDVEFGHATFVGCSFVGASLICADFRGCDIEKTTFDAGGKRRARMPKEPEHYVPPPRYTNEYDTFKRWVPCRFCGDHFCHGC